MEINHMFEFLIDGIYAIGIVALIVKLVMSKEEEEKIRALTGLLGLLVLPFLVVNYTDFRPFFITMMQNTVTQVVSNTQLLRDYSLRISQGDISSLAIDLPFKNLLDGFYVTGMILYAIIVTLAIMVTSAISAFLQGVWRLITGK